MDRRIPVVLITAVALLASCIFSCLSGVAGAETITKSDCSFSVDVPCTTVIKSQTGHSGEFANIYACNGLAYVVFASKVKGGATASGEIDETLRRAVGRVSEAPRLSYQSRQGVSFKGIAVTGDFGEADASLKTIIGNGKAHLTVYAAPNDQAGVVVIVGALGPSSRTSEIDNAAVALASSVIFLNLPSGTATNSIPSSKSGTLSSGSVTAVAPSKPFNDLKKGEIELVGVVDSIEKNAKKLNILAVQVASFGSVPAFINPPRLKMVTFDSLPEGVKVGASVVVVGPNSGSGKPLKASSVVLLTSDMMEKKEK